MENIKKEEQKTYKNTPDEIRMKKAELVDTLDRLQMVFRGSCLYVEEALDMISLATHHAGFRLERNEIHVNIEGCDGRPIWDADIWEIDESYFIGMWVRRIYAHDGDCTIVLSDFTEEPEEEESENE